MATSFVLHRDASRVLPTAVRGEGPYLFDADGKRYLDGSGGPGVSCLGHSHPRVVEAMRRQAEALPYAWTGSFTNEPMEALAEALVREAPAPLARALFVSSGSEATEAALKLARQYHVERGELSRTRFIARASSYHGNTLGALAVSGHRKRRSGYESLLAEAWFLSPCYPYRGKRDDEGDIDYTRRLAEELDEAIRTLGPANVAGFVAETVVGASAGVLLPSPGYFREMRSVCERHGVLMILDEVLCGMGRTGSMYAFDPEGVVPDIVILAKGLGAGFAPIGGLVVSARVVEALESGSGKLAHGQTYMGHAISCAAALAVVRTIQEENLLANVGERGQELELRLRERFSQHPNVGDIRGRGLLWGLELVEDRSSKKPFPSERQVFAHVRDRALAAGLLCYPGGGWLGEPRGGDHVLLAPPYNVEERHLDELVDKLAVAFDQVL